MSAGEAGSLTPSRRSYADLSEQVHQLFREHCKSGDDGSITLQALPSILERFEHRRGIKILATDELDALKAMAATPGMDLQTVTADSLIPMLAQLIAASGEMDEPPPLPTKDLAPPSPRSLTGSESPQSMDWSTRSPRDVPALSGSGTLDLPASSSFSFSPGLEAPADPSMKLFPRSHSAHATLGGGLASPPATPTPPSHKRSHTLSDASRPEAFAQQQSKADTPQSALAARHRSTPLEALRSSDHARPRRQNRRRESGETGPRSGDTSRAASEEPGSPPFAMSSPTQPNTRTSFGPPHHAHTESEPAVGPRQLNEGSAHQHTLSAPDGLRSPPLDLTSFRSHPLSPPTEEEPTTLHQLFTQPSSSSLSSTEMSRPGSHFLREGFGANDRGMMAFRPDSMASVNSLNVGELGGEQVLQLFRDAQELQRKLKESEATKSKLSEDHEAQVMDLNVRIDELSAELSAKKREEKEVRAKRDQHLSTIKEHEKDLQRLDTQLSRERDLHADMKRRFEEQCDESEKLRNDIRGKEQALRSVEEEMAELRSEHAKIQHEIHFAELRIKELEDEVAAAQKAHFELRAQKAANLSLQEELNRLRLEIETANARQSSAAQSGLASAPTSVSRSLGRELERRLAAMQQDEEPGSGSDTEGESDAQVAMRRSTSSSSSSESYVEETITRIRRKKNKAADLAGEVKTDLVIDVTDASTQTSALVNSLASSPMRPQASTSTHIHDGAPPPYTPPSDTFHMLLERYVPPMGLRPLAKRSPFLYSIIESTAGFCFYSISLYLVGVLTGIVVFPSRSHHYTGLGDAERLFAVYNTMPDDRLWSAATGGAHWKQRLLFWLSEWVTRTRIPGFN